MAISYHSLCLFWVLLIINIHNSLSVFQTYVKFNAKNIKTGETIDICVNKQPQKTPENLTETQFFILNDIPDETILCKKHKNYTFDGEILVDGYHYNPIWPIHKKCEKEFYNNALNRILYAQEAKASSMLFRVPKTYASFNVKKLNNASIVHIPLFFINEHNYELLRSLYNNQNNRSKEVQLNVEKGGSAFINGGLCVLLLITMFCIIFGGLWSGYTYRQLHLAAQSRVQKAALDAESGVNAAGQGQPQEDQKRLSNASDVPAKPFNFCSLACLLIMVVSMLLLFYYFFDVLVWFIIILFTVMTSFTSFSCLNFIWCQIFNDKFDKTEINFAIICQCFKSCCKKFVENLKWKLSIRKFILYLICLSISIFWFVTRKEYYSFFIHDIISILFCIHAIKNLRMPSLMWVTVLLSCMLIYDLFMVFITPFFTKEGCSIMVEAVTGGGCSSNRTGPPDPNKEEMPIVFRVPEFTNPMMDCYNITIDLQYPMTILGFGDVLLPGLLIGYNFAFDLAWKVNYKLYFVISSIGYFFGMITTFIALHLMSTAQPALIYLVPFTLIPTHLLALIKKQWLDMWNGNFPDEENLVQSPTSVLISNEAKLVTPEDGDILAD